MRDTGYLVDSNRQIIGYFGPTGFLLNEDDYIIKDGREIGVYIEDGYFFKAGPWLWFFTVYSRTGHTLASDGKVMGDSASLPWRSE